MTSPSLLKSLTALAVTGVFAVGCADPLPPDPRSDAVTMENPGLDKETDTETEMERIDDLTTNRNEAITDSRTNTTRFEGMVTDVQATALTLRRGEDKPQTFAVSPQVIVNRGEETKSGIAPLSSIEAGQRVELAAEREDAGNTTIYVVRRITVLAESEDPVQATKSQAPLETTASEEPKADDKNADAEKEETETPDDSKDADTSN